MKQKLNITHPDGTEIIRRISDGREYIMLLNYTANRMDMNVKGKSLLNNETFNGTLGGYGVEILEI